MRRRALLAVSALLPTAVAQSDPDVEVRQLLADAAAALSEANPEAFLRCFSIPEPERAAWRERLRILFARAEVSSSVSILSNRADGVARVLEIDWFLAIQKKDQTAPVERRRAILRARLERIGKRWRLVSLEPEQFFEAPS
jgi:hypothetical protein